MEQKTWEGALPQRPTDCSSLRPRGSLKAMRVSWSSADLELVRMQLVVESWMVGWSWDSEGSGQKKKVPNSTGEKKKWVKRTNLPKSCGPQGFYLRPIARSWFLWHQRVHPPTNLELRVEVCWIWFILDSNNSVSVVTCFCKCLR